MPERKTIERARAKKRAGDRPSTQAGEFVREEMDHVKRGKHGVKNRKQAIAIGLSKARRAGVDLAPPEKGRAKSKTRRSAASARKRGQAEGSLSGRKRTSTKKRSSTSTTSRGGTKRKRSVRTAAKKPTTRRRRTPSTSRKRAAS